MPDSQGTDTAKARVLPQSMFDIFQDIFLHSGATTSLDKAAKRPTLEIDPRPQRIDTAKATTSLNKNTSFFSIKVYAKNIEKCNLHKEMPLQDAACSSRACKYMYKKLAKQFKK